LLGHASAILLAHNHPSGSLKPSTSDCELTTKLIAGARLLDLQILDHLIFTDTGFFSFADEGLI
jgi:DNA repair protein RadC